MSDVYISFGGDTAGLEAALSVAKAEVNNLKKEMTELGREMQRTGSSASSELGQSLRLVAENLVAAKTHASGLTQELKGVGHASGEAGSFFSRFSSGIKESLEGVAGFNAGLAGMIEVIAAAFAIEKIAQFVESMTTLGRETTKASQVLGISGESVAGLGLIAKASGLELNSLEMAFSRLSRNVVDQTSGAKRALDALGLSFKDLQGKDANEQLSLLADTFSKIKDGSEKDAAGVALFGRSFNNLLPLLNEGKAGLSEWSKIAEETGVQLDTKTRAAMAATEQQTIRLGSAIRGDGISIFKEFEPVIDGVVKLVGDLAISFSRAMKEGGLLKATFDVLVFSLQITMTVIIATKTVLQELGQVGIMVISGISQSFQNLGIIIKDVFVSIAGGIGNFFSGLITAGVSATKTVANEFVNLAQIISNSFSGNFSAAKEAFSRMGTDAAEGGSKIKNAFLSSLNGFDFTQVRTDMEAGWNETKRINAVGTAELVRIAKEGAAEVRTTWGAGAEGASNEVEKHTIKMANAHKETGKAAREAARMAIDSLNEEIKVVQDASAEKKKALDDALAHHRISSSEWLSASISFLKEEEGAVKSLYEKELQVASLTASEKVKIKIQEADAIRKIEMQMVEDARKASDENQKTWLNALSTITGSFNSHLRGLLAGTTSWAEAAKHILGDLIIKAIEGFEKMAIQWIANQLTMTAATTAGAAARSAAEAASGTVGVAASIMGILKKIGAEAAQTFGGIFAFLSPVMGPAAAGPAVAGQASVMAAGAAISSFDTGSWSVPNDMLASIHQGEMVVPQRGGIADEFREMMSNGGPSGGKSKGDTHLHINAIDAQSVVQLFKNNGREFAKIIKQQIDNNPSLRPAY